MRGEENVDGRSRLRGQERVDGISRMRGGKGKMVELVVRGKKREDIRGGGERVKWENRVEVVKGKKSVDSRVSGQRAKESRWYKK